MKYGRCLQSFKINNLKVYTLQTHFLTLETYDVNVTALGGASPKALV
jgi:hypothetical protein